MKQFWRNLPHRTNYYLKKIFNFIGLCDRCFCKVNYTKSGRAICPKCGR